MPASPPIEVFIKDQIEKWKQQTHSNVPVITISSQPGSGGRMLAESIARRLNIDWFDRDIIKEIAESAHISGTVNRCAGFHRFSGQ